MNPYSLNITKDGRPPVFETPDEMSNQIEAYFTSLWDEEEERLIKKPTMTGMALFLGFSSRQSMYDYAKKEEFSYIVARAQCTIEQSYEELLSTKISSGAIFALKNMGWADKTSIDLHGPNKEPMTPEERQERIKQLIKEAQKDDKGE